MTFSMDNFRLDGKVALVTGGVYGIGFEIASSLAAAGATIVFNSINQESVDQGNRLCVRCNRRRTGPSDGC